MILDTCTKFMIVCKSDHFDTASTTKILNSAFSEHGILFSIRCDRGSNFLSDSFRHYAKILNIDLSYSSAYHHSSNLAECAICTVKNLMKWCYHANESWRLALLEYFATPLNSNLPSPSEPNGRQFSGLLPNLKHNSLPDSTSEALIDQHKKQLNHAHGKELRDLPEGSTVSYYDHTGQCWRTGLVQERKDKSCIIANDKGLFISRNWVDLRPTNTDYIVHHNPDIPHSTNDSAVNTKVVVSNPHSTFPSSTNPHSTKCNASNKSAQKLKPSTGNQRVNQFIVTHLGCTVKPPNKLNL